ncbi:hypothetical protein BH24ACT3_BH24ACT3_18260 [soil metagenome]
MGLGVTRSARAPREISLAFPPPGVPAMAERVTSGGTSVVTALAGKRPAAMTSRSERALFGAVQTGDLDGLAQLTSRQAELTIPGGTLLGLVLAECEPDRAIVVLDEVLAQGKDPAAHRFLRKYLPQLQVRVGLAPGLEAVMDLDRTALSLVAAELERGLDRAATAAHRLDALPTDPLVAMARAAAHLASGQTDEVIALTEEAINEDDLSALLLVARGVALRSDSKLIEALGAFDAATAEEARRPDVRRVGLEERAQTLRMCGRETDAQADLGRAAELAAEAEVAGRDTAVEATSGAVATAPAPNPGAGEPVGQPGDPADPAMAEALAPAEVDALVHDSLRSAEARVRRQLRGTPQPGTFGGRHHSSFVEEVTQMTSTGLYEAAEGLLLGLIDAVEDEADEVGQAVEATYYLTLADLMADQGFAAAEVMVLERYRAACRRTGGDPVDCTERIAAAEGELRASFLPSPAST